MSRRGRGADGRNGGSDHYDRRERGRGAGWRRTPRVTRPDAGGRGGAGNTGRVDDAVRIEQPSADRRPAPDLAAHAARLADLAAVPDEVLSSLVAAHGLCLWEITSGDPPSAWSGDRPPDRELAARLCAGCPVRDECLEFELRTAGAETVGVWGGLGEDDRRALHAIWSVRAGRRVSRSDGLADRGEHEQHDQDQHDDDSGGEQR